MKHQTPTFPLRADAQASGTACLSKPANICFKGNGIEIFDDVCHNTTRSLLKLLQHQLGVQIQGCFGVAGLLQFVPGHSGAMCFSASKYQISVSTKFLGRFSTIDYGSLLSFYCFS